MTAMAWMAPVLAGARVRLVRQSEIADCGLACLAMVFGFHGHRVSLGGLRQRFAPSMRGASLRSLMAIAGELGLAPRAVQLPLEALENLVVPAVLHWDLNHFVVLERVRRGRCLIHDPARGSRWMKLAEVSAHFTGVAMEVRAGPDFRPGRDPHRLGLRQLWGNTLGAKRALVQLLLLSAILQLFALASPYYLQVAVDTALPALDAPLLVVLAVGFGIFTVINAGAALLRAQVLLAAGTAFGFGLTSNLALRLCRLPTGWFERRHVGDILSRFQSVAPIQALLSHEAVAAVVDGAMAVLTLALMCWYSPMLAAIALGAFGCYALVRFALFATERTARQAAILAHGDEQSFLIETLRGMPTLRLFGQEGLRHAAWQSRFIAACNADLRAGRLVAWQNAANLLIFGLEQVLTIALAIGMVLHGDGFSTGMVFAYLSLRAQFLQKAASLTDQAVAFRMLGLHLERLSDIALAEEDVGFAEPTECARLLQGGILLRGIRYRYASTEPLVLDGIDLAIAPGEHVAITGPSGGGKSTLAKILLGMAEPESGEMRVDGVPLARFGRRAYRRQIAAVLQDDALFSGSLAQNVALFEEEVDMARVAECCRAAAIHADILQMPMRYETLVGDMGSSLSGGQRQRLLLARALYRRPAILVLDEGSAFLDEAHERAVNAAIRAMGITRIVIAHRRETIAAADRVVVLAGGRLHAAEKPKLSMAADRDFAWQSGSEGRRREE